MRIAHCTTLLARLVLVTGLALGATLLPPAAQAAEMVTGLGGTSGYGAVALGRNDDSSSGVIALGAGFPAGIKLYSGTYTTLYINNNGNLTFRAPLGTYTPQPFPITNLPMLAAFWGDVDTRGGLADPAANNVYFSTASPGKFIATWNKVGYYSGATNKLNTFQIVLTDRSEIAQGDFDIEYRYAQLEWTTGSASGGSNGLGGTPAQMGYDAGDGSNFYRHPGSGTAGILDLTTTSNVGEPGVWRFEVRGGTPNPVKTPQLVNVRLIQTLNASDIDIDPASFVTPPARTASANGQTTIEWDFAAFPANISKDLSYDVVFRNPVPGERRQLIAKLELLYNDVNGNAVRTELGPEFVQVLPSIYRVTPSTDRPAYGANENVLISSLVNNLSAFPASGAVRLSVLDANGVAVASLGTATAQQIAAGGSSVFGAVAFPTGTTYAGAYSILAELLDTGGRVQASGNASFTIGSNPSGQARVAISTDKPVYSAYETVRIADRVSNTLANASLNAVNLVTTVLNPDGSVRLSRTEALAQLPPNAVRDFAYTLALGWAAVGDYRANLVLTGADGATLAQASTTFAVASSAQTGAGLTGALVATPAVVNSGATVGLRFSVTNDGNAPVSGLPLTVSIVDVAEERVLASHPYVASLAVGGQYPGSVDWVAESSPSGRYVALLNVTVGGTTRVLAQQALTVLTLDIAQQPGGRNRVLGLVSCAEEATSTTSTAGNAACVTARSATMAQALQAAGVNYAIATSSADFKRGLRSGLYNTYWISGKQDKLEGQLASEVREAVFGGDGVLVDGEHDQRNGALDAMAGVRWKGKLGQVDLAAELAGPVFASARLGTSGRSDRLELAGGTLQGVLAASGPHAGAPAIVSNQFGAGRAVQYAFDLPSSLRGEGGWQDVIATSLLHVLPPVASQLAPGAVFAAGVSVTNAGPATDIAVTTTLPPGAGFLSALPEARYDAARGTLDWSANLAPTQAWTAGMTLRAPLEAGAFSLGTVVSTIDPGTGAAMPYGAPLQWQLTVVGAAQNASTARAALQALAPLSTPDRHLRDRLVADVDRAMLAMRANTADGYDTTIAQLIGVIDRLDGLAGVNTRPVRDSLNKIVREAQWRWSLATSTPPSTGN